MRKIISFVIVITLLAGILQFGFTNTYAVRVEEISINNFIEDGVKLIRENDIGKEFAPENIEYHSSLENALKYKTIKRSAEQFPANKDETVNEETLSDTAFQTCRLLVKATKTPDRLNSTGMASGFRDWFIVQFETEEDAEKAYETYSEYNSVLSVSPDLVLNNSFDESENAKQAEYDTDGMSTRLNSWGSIMTGLYDVKDYIDSHPEFDREITIGVVDTGIDVDNEFVKDRLIRTYFNSSTEGNENSEYTQNAHGTMVSSVIVDNTPETVKIKVYKYGNGQESISALSSIALALIKATDDKVNIMNCSFSASDSSDLIKDALDYVFENDIPLIASAGNSHHNMSAYRWLPGYDIRSISVAGYKNNGNPTSFTSYGKSIDLMAPAEDIPVSGGNNNYSFQNGTSLSAPMVASLFSDLMIMFPSYSNKELESIINSNADSSDIFYDCSLFGYGVIDGIGSAGLERNCAPVFSLPEGKYIDENEIEIIAEPSCEIYYTLDGTYPSKESGIHYFEPIKISDDCVFLKAVAYGNGKYRSECTKSFYRFQQVGTSDMFEITYDGQIKTYTGNITNLIIPETIDGITVRSLSPQVFSESGLVGISFPDTMTTVSEEAFLGCNSLMFADGKNITVIENSAFKECKRLYSIDFPNVTVIENYAFLRDVALSAVCFPKCKVVGDEAFAGCSSLRKADMPDLVSAGWYSFNCSLLTEADFPNLKLNDLEFLRSKYIYCLDLPLLENVCETFFYSTRSDALLTERVELSNVKTIESLPLLLNLVFDEPVTMVIPSTFESYNMSGADLDFVSPKMLIYGSRGTYAEQWANENEFEFIEISQETAIINDLPNEYYDNMHYLYADVVGFNRTYQWYGSYSDNNTDGIPIVGATERRFVPKDNEQYPYYYCVVTSTDVGYDPIEIRTGASRYMEFNGEMPNADYSSLDEILATVPKDLSIYTDESVAALNEIINSIDRNLNVSNQTTVDGYVEAISNALSALKLKEHMVSFIVDNESVLSYELEYGSEITDIPPNPDKTGYTFSKWTPDIPPAMPNNSLTFTAEFEPVTYYASFIVDGEEKEKVPFTVESISISEPDVPIKTGYTGKWSDYILSASDVNISAVYTPITYYATFTADGNQVGDKVPFTVESISITEPAVPEKEGYENGRWEDYTLGATDITINSVYDKIEGTCSHVDSNDDGKCDKCGEPMTYTKDIIVDGVKIGEVTFTYGDSIIDNLPDVPAKTGYTGEWEYTINGSNLDIHPQYTPITYYATFKADGNQVGEKVPFTVESESISEPIIPDKEGYTGKWSEYVIAASDITINAEYIINEYTVSFVADDKTVNSESVEYGSPIKIPDNPHKEGYIFKEWLPKVPETMPAKNMSFYAVFEKKQDPLVTTSISINNYVNVRTVDYKTTITFTALTDSMPEGAKIVWYKDSQRAGTGEKFTVTDAREAFTVQAKIVDESGNVLNASETELVKVKTDFFSKIIAFFRMLFGKLPIIE